MLVVVIVRNRYTEPNAIASDATHLRWLRCDAAINRKAQIIALAQARSAFSPENRAAQ